MHDLAEELHALRLHRRHRGGGAGTEGAGDLPVWALGIHRVT
ncbi:hypothetical protein [Streptomyces cyaneogriseus]|nr:hypothetical protein [Streptomyces cyaneogriseus]